MVYFITIFSVINSNNMVENGIENDWSNGVAAIVSNHKSNNMALPRAHEPKLKSKAGK